MRKHETNNRIQQTFDGIEDPLGRDERAPSKSPYARHRYALADLECWFDSQVAESAGTPQFSDPLAPRRSTSIRHPYALADLASEAEGRSLTSDALLRIDGTAVRDNASEPRCSKNDFRTRCRAIFSGYVPAIEGGKIRSHHRDFIARNESRTPEERYKLLAQLTKYDLSSLPGLRGQFNRERQVFTEEKLRLIERCLEEKK